MTCSVARRKRKGCLVCGDRFVQDRSLPCAARRTCAPCKLDILLTNGLLEAKHDLLLIVDGSFINYGGQRDASGPGYAGAGLVLVNMSQDVLYAAKSCGFIADHSSHAEAEAIVRGARWAPGVPVVSDSSSEAARLAVESGRDIRFFNRGDRGPFYQLAHQLSTEGRKRITQYVQTCQAEVTEQRIAV